MDTNLEMYKKIFKNIHLPFVFLSFKIGGSHLAAGLLDYMKSNSKNATSLDAAFMQRYHR